MDASRHSEYRACLAIRHTPYIGPRGWKKLLDEYGAARPALDDAHAWADRTLVDRRGVRGYLAGAYKDGARQEYEAARATGCKVLLWTDPQYPERLRNIPDPPLFLYYDGRLDLLSGPGVAVVGSRKCSPEGMTLATKICKGLTETGITIVSGMAWGIDRQAHLAGLSGAGSSIAVLGTGLDLVYPPANADLRDSLSANGLIVTEFAPGTRPEPHNFPYRNRIVSGLSLGVVVVEAAMKSGSRITARLALEQGRDVYAVHGPQEGAGFDGCRDLIEQGARDITSAGEVILDLAALIKNDAERVLAAARTEQEQPVTAQQDVPPDGPVSGAASEDEKLVVAALDTEDRRHIDELSRSLQWDPGRASRTLLQLEVRGLVRQWPGMMYSLA